MTPTPPQSPAEFEQQELNKLAQLEQKRIMRSQVFEVEARQFGLTPERMNGWIDTLLEWERMYRTYEPGAQYLLNLGMPNLMHRLNAILADLREAISIYQQMIQASGQGQIRRQAEADEARKVWDKTLQEQTQKSGELHDEMNEKWGRAFRVDCPHCGYHLGTYLVNYCPHCGRKIFA